MKGHIVTQNLENQIYNNMLYSGCGSKKITIFHIIYMYDDKLI